MLLMSSHRMIKTLRKVPPPWPKWKYPKAYEIAIILAIKLTLLGNLGGLHLGSGDD